MDKKGHMPIWGFIILMGAIIFVGIVICIFGIRETKECEKNYPELEGECNSVSKECFEDCNRINQAYFKHHYSSAFFSATIKECFCVKDEEVKRIW